MNGTNSEPRFENGRDTKNGSFKIEIDPKVGDTIQGGIQGGFEALGQLLSGFVKSIHDAIGPEMMRNMSASQWLARVAEALDEVAAAWNSRSATPSGKAGELACYLERLSEETEGSRVESQQAALCDRLSQAIAAVEAEQTDSKSLVSNVAGYFRAAAKSAMPSAS